MVCRTGALTWDVGDWVQLPALLYCPPISINPIVSIDDLAVFKVFRRMPRYLQVTSLQRKVGSINVQSSLSQVEIAVSVYLQPLYLAASKIQ